MSNFYNNNNRGIYGNQNQYQPNQNNYSGPGYVPPSGTPATIYGKLNPPNYNQQNYNQGNNYNQPNYNQGNNYNQQNYNQQNFNQGNNFNQNQNNNGPLPFISGHIGRLLISSEDIDTFSKSLRTTEWTNNPNYLQAKNVDVKMKISLKGQLQYDVNSPPRNRFNDYITNSNFNFNEFQNFLKTVEDENKIKKENVDKERNEFLKVNFPNEKPDISNDDLYKKIAENKKGVVEKDTSLYGKCERFLVPSVQPLMPPVQSSGIYDFTRSNTDGKAFQSSGIYASQFGY
jgi:hypothetical protein